MPVDIIKIHHLPSQKRSPRADFRAQVELEFLREGVKYPWTPNEEDVKKYARVLVHDWEDEGSGDWASYRLKDIRKVADNRWYIKIEQPYLD